MNSFNEFRNGNTERLRQPDNAEKARIPDSSFDAADIGPVEFGFFREPILRKAFRFTLPEDVAGEGMKSTVARGSHARGFYAAALRPSVNDRLQCSKREHRSAGASPAQLSQHVLSFTRERRV